MPANISKLKITILTIFIICNQLFPNHVTAQVAASFETEDVEFYNGEIKLAATIYLPKQKGKHPAIAVTHGSGREDKSGGGYISLASTLANAGFVVLLYDKRGVGKSTGEYIETPDMAIPTGDLVNAVKYLMARNEVNKNKIGVYGHSQGGWVAPLAAIICKDISFVVAGCGGGISIREQVLFSLRKEFRGKGYSSELIDSIVNFTRSFYTYLGTGIGYTSTNALYEQAVKQPWFSFFRQMHFTDQLPPPSMLKEPPFNFFKAINYDPQSTLRAIEVPTLVILAGRDESVPSERAKQLWDDAFYASGHTNNLSIILLSEEDHYDFERVDGKVRYKKKFADVLVNWLKEKIHD